MVSKYVPAVSDVARLKVAELAVEVSQEMPALLFGVKVNDLFPTPLVAENTWVNVSPNVFTASYAPTAALVYRLEDW
jgi:hypothetical protein